MRAVIPDPNLAQSIDTVFGNIEQIQTQQTAFAAQLEQAVAADGG